MKNRKITELMSRLNPDFAHVIPSAAAPATTTTRQSRRLVGLRSLRLIFRDQPCSVSWYRVHFRGLDRAVQNRNKNRQHKHRHEVKRRKNSFI